MLNEIGVRDTRDELETYIKESVENLNLMIGIEYAVLHWWRRNNFKFSVLPEIARDVLAMQVSSVASKSAFSTSGKIIDPYRSCLTHYMVAILICTEQWMKQDIRCESRVLTNAQVLVEVEDSNKLERGNRKKDAMEVLFQFGVCCIGLLALWKNSLEFVVSFSLEFVGFIDISV